MGIIHSFHRFFYTENLRDIESAAMDNNINFLKTLRSIVQGKIDNGIKNSTFYDDIYNHRCMLSEILIRCSAMRSVTDEILIELIDMGAYIHKCGDTLLINAAINDRFTLMKKLVSMNAGVRRQLDATLMTAAPTASLEMIKYLVEQGAIMHDADAIRAAYRAGNNDVGDYLSSIHLKST